MPELLIERDHPLGLEQARRTAAQWMQEAQQKFDMQCSYTPGEGCDVVNFARTGLSGTLEISATAFRLQAQLGFLLGAFRDRIEAQIQDNLDQLIAAHTRG